MSAMRTAVMPALATLMAVACARAQTPATVDHDAQGNARHVFALADFEGGEGATVEDLDGRRVVVTGVEKATWTGTLHLPAGSFIITLEAWATNAGNDSIIFSLDGREEETRWFGGGQRQALAVLRLDEERDVPIVLRQREGPGTTLAAIIAEPEGAGLARIPVAVRPELAGRHPRIILTADTIPAIRARLNSDAQRDAWQELYAATARRAAQAPPEDPPNTEDPFRGFGDRLAAFAFAYAMQPDPDLLAGTKRWIEAVCAYPSWAGDVDLGAGHICFGLALAYDWLYDELTPEERAMIEERLTRQARILFEQSVTHTGGWWSSAWWQNHCWINHCGLSTAGMALLDVLQDEAQTWVDYVRARFDVTLRVFGPDGANHEGPAYSVYGTQWLLHYLETLRSFSGEDLYDNPYLQRYATYRLHVGMPDWENVVNYGDCPPTEWGPPVAHLRRLAAQYRDGHAQWLASRMAAARGWTGYDSWQSALWHDPTVAEQPPGDLPTWHWFDDLDLAVFRTGWGPDAAVAALKCGPPLGHAGIAHMHEMSEASMGAGHDNPDANAIYLWVGGGWRIGDPAAYTHDKATALENTITVAGMDQLGRSEWFAGEQYLSLPEQPHIVRAQSTDVADLAEGEAGPAYPAGADVSSFRRIMLFVKGAEPMLVLLDRIALAQPQPIAWYYHAFAPFEVEDDGGFRTGGDFPAFGRVRILGAVQPTMTAESVMVVSHNAQRRASGELEHKGEQVRIDLPAEGTLVRAVTVLGARPVELSMAERDGIVVAEVAGLTVAWHDDGTIELSGEGIYARFDPVGDPPEMR